MAARTAARGLPVLQSPAREIRSRLPDCKARSVLLWRVEGHAEPVLSCEASWPFAVLGHLAARTQEIRERLMEREAETWERSSRAPEGHAPSWPRFVT